MIYAFTFVLDMARRAEHWLAHQEVDFEPDWTAFAAAASS